MKLDDFEAVFRSSVKDVFVLDPPEVRRAALVSDLDDEATAELGERVKRFLGEAASSIEWSTVRADAYASVPEVVGALHGQEPDLVVGYRHLRGGARELPHSLGSTIDTITQATSFPVLLLPPPTRAGFADRLAPIERVLVITDHLAGDHRLANWGVSMCPKQGELYLAHVEDDITFARYAEILGMIRGIDDEHVVGELRQKLLGRAEYYISSIAAVLEDHGIQEIVKPIVTMGHTLADYQRMIDEHDIQLVILNTKDDDQLAMRGMAYAISVEIQHRPLLLL